MASEQRTRVVESRDMVGGGGWGKSLQAGQDYILVWRPMSFCGAVRDKLEVDACNRQFMPRKQTMTLRPPLCPYMDI